MTTKRGTKKTNVSLDTWAQSVERSSSCHTCSNKEASDVIREILEAMDRNNASHITLRQIHRKVRELCPNYTVGYWGFRSHLYEHERDLYARAKGKGKGR